MKDSVFKSLSIDVMKIIKHREVGSKENYREGYRKLRNKLQKIYSDHANEEAPALTRREMLKLDADTAKIITSMYKGNKKAVENTLLEIINRAYKEVNKSASKYNIEAIARDIDIKDIVNKQVAGHIWTERIDKYGNDFVYKLQGTIRNGISNGDTYTSIAKNIKTEFGKDIGNTMRIARTEGARVLEDSKYQAFEDIADNENVQVFKIWHTMGDEAVRDTHEAMEGVKVPYDEEFILPSGARCQYPKDTGVAAEDINCRCYVEYVTELVKNDKNLEKMKEIGYNKDDITIYKSLSAAAFRDVVKLPDGTYSKISEGTKITKVFVFAGGKTGKKVKVAKYLAKQYGNKEKDWSKVRGEGFVDIKDSSKKCELHWFESNKTGRVKMKVKRWFDDEN